MEMTLTMPSTVNAQSMLELGKKLLKKYPERADDLLDCGQCEVSSGKDISGLVVHPNFRFTNPKDDVVRAFPRELKVSGETVKEQGLILEFSIDVSKNTSSELAENSLREIENSGTNGNDSRRVRILFGPSRKNNALSADMQRIEIVSKGQ